MNLQLVCRLTAGLGFDQTQQLRHAPGFGDFVDRKFDAEFFFNTDNQFDLREAVPSGEIMLRMVHAQLQGLVFEHFPEDALESNEVEIHGVLPIYHAVDGR